jgi:CheY-like chemotaxis protein
VLQPKVLVLDQVVADMEKMLRRLIGEHIRLVTQFLAQRGAARADPGQLHQVLLNLAVNARDAMPEGGELRIEVADVDLAEANALEHPGLAPGSWVMLAVSDTGCGMDAETRARLFEPFFTTKEQGKGTGLGLSTVYGIVKQSGGHISVDSAVGQGSTFRIYLPMVEREVIPPSRGREVQTDMISGCETILLVEDDASVRDLAREVLEMNGYTVIEAGDGAEALAIYGEKSSEIDMMVTDLVMPRLGGRELAREVAREQPRLPVLYLSGYTDSAVLHQGGLDGSYFLQKPFTPAALAHKIREVLDAAERSA